MILSVSIYESVTIRGATIRSLACLCSNVLGVLVWTYLTYQASVERDPNERDCNVYIDMSMVGLMSAQFWITSCRGYEGIEVETVAEKFQSLVYQIQRFMSPYYSFKYHVWLSFYRMWRHSLSSGEPAPSAFFRLCSI